MKIGIMNSPVLALMPQARWAKKNGFDFIDLTLEPTDTDSSKWNNKRIAGFKKYLKENKMGVVGHTSPFGAMNLPFKSLRDETLKEFKKDLLICSELGIKFMNVHLIPAFRLFAKEEYKWYCHILKELVKEGKKHKVKVMIEFIDASKRQIELTDKLMKNIPGLYLHIDVGHANLNSKTNKTEYFLKKYPKRIGHIHMSDNKGGDKDMHVCLGHGKINWRKIVKLLKKYKYDSTITLEVFTGKKELLQSKKYLRSLWEKC
ncbi:sugar phosphate isomerase/epimerase [Candidatus Woesearchaeota archaeon]|nr:sugar phosphate isomerase/epimerase [Candidatus Woesearchaeota archaeon]